MYNLSICIIFRDNNNFYELLEIGKRRYNIKILSYKTIFAVILLVLLLYQEELYISKMSEFSSSLCLLMYLL